MSKQQDFLKQQLAAQKRVAAAQDLVNETKALLEAAVKNKMLKTSERLSNQLKRQETALAHARAELSEWENLKS